MYSVADTPKNSLICKVFNLQQKSNYPSMGTHFALNTMEGALPMILDEVEKWSRLVFFWDKGSDF